MSDENQSTELEYSCLTKLAEHRHAASAACHRLAAAVGPHKHLVHQAAEHDPMVFSAVTNEIIFRTRISRLLSVPKERDEEDAIDEQAVA